MASLRVVPRRRVFYSFHYQPDSWRAGRVRNIGAIEGNRPASDNDWETVKGGGDAAIKRWIDDQMRGRSCTVVLVGSSTANRKWINYEICKSWENNMGLVGIRIHGLEDNNGSTSYQGRNPFDYIKLKPRSETLSLRHKDLSSSYVNCYSPEGSNSRDKYHWIVENLSIVIEKAIKDVSQRKYLMPLS